MKKKKDTKVMGNKDLHIIIRAWFKIALIFLSLMCFRNNNINDKNHKL